MQSRSNLLPQINGRMSLNKNDTDGTLNNNTTFSSSSTQQQNSASLSQSIYNYGNYARLSGSKARALQSDSELDSANDSLIIRVSEAYFNVLTAIDTGLIDRVRLGITPQVPEGLLNAALTHLLGQSPRVAVLSKEGTTDEGEANRDQP